MFIVPSLIKSILTSIFPTQSRQQAEVLAPTTNASIYCDLGISTSPVDNSYSNTTKVVQSGKSADIVTIEIDITGYQGSYYVDLLADVGNTLHIYKVWLEK